MHLHDLLDPGDSAAMEDQGYIDVRPHPTEPLAICNYTKKTAWERKWNPVTSACRGLIYNYVTMEVVARPFEKFFNYEEVTAGLTDLTTLDELSRHPVEITDKVDGSLGIIYPRSDGTFAVATRGSFMSDQAIHATEVLNTRYPDFVPWDGLTYLVEIIYADNRIVLNYGDMDDLVFLGAREIESGEDYGPRYAKLLGWPGPVTKTFPGVNLAYALQMAPRENAEGVVVTFHDGTRVKIKQADYVELHRIVTGMTDRRIWEMMGEGMTVDQIKAPLPEEFHPWVDRVSNELSVQAADIFLGVCDEFHEVLQALPTDYARKDFAVAVKDSPNRAYLFMFLDGKPMWDVVWKSIRPEAGRSMNENPEEAE